jgi:phytol kinase
MQSQLLWLIIFLLLIGLLIIIAEILHRKFKLKPELSRKFLHVSGGMLCLLFPFIFTSHWWILVLAAVAFIILFITYYKKQLPSVHQTKRFSVGSILFPIPVYLCFLVAEKTGNNIFFYLPVSLLAISDTAAEIGGNLWGHHSRQFFNGQKTMAGLLSFFITALAVCFICINSTADLSNTELIKLTVLISVCTAIAETITLYGWDNLSVPVTAILILFYFMESKSGLP